jgi:hypothetical protein
MSNLNLSEPENEPNLEIVAGSIMGTLALDEIVDCSSQDQTKKNPTTMATVAVVEPMAGGTTILPATFLRTICDQLEYYFCDENLLGDLYLLKNMNMNGYGKQTVRQIHFLF